MRPNTTGNLNPSLAIYHRGTLLLGEEAFLKKRAGHGTEFQGAFGGVHGFGACFKLQLPSEEPLQEGSCYKYLGSAIGSHRFTVFYGIRPTCSKLGWTRL